MSDALGPAPAAGAADAVLPVAAELLNADSPTSAVSATDRGVSCAVVDVAAELQGVPAAAQPTRSPAEIAFCGTGVAGGVAGAEGASDTEPRPSLRLPERAGASDAVVPPLRRSSPDGIADLVARPSFASPPADMPLLLLHSAPPSRGSSGGGCGWVLASLWLWLRACADFSSRSRLPSDAGRSPNEPHSPSRSELVHANDGHLLPTHCHTDKAGHV